TSRPSTTTSRSTRSVTVAAYGTQPLAPPCQLGVRFRRLLTAAKSGAKPALSRNCDPCPAGGARSPAVQRDEPTLEERVRFATGRSCRRVLTDLDRQEDPDAPEANPRPGHRGRRPGRRLRRRLRRVRRAPRER